MHAIVTTLTTATLLIHGFLGCCFCGAPSVATQNVAASDCGSRCCSASRDAGIPCEPTPADEQAPSAPRPCQSHCHADCTFLVQQKVCLDHAALSMELAALATPCVAIDCKEHAISSVPAFSQALEPPLRLHLLNQSMLI